MFTIRHSSPPEAVNLNGSTKAQILFSPAETIVSPSMTFSASSSLFPARHFQPDLALYRAQWQAAFMLSQQQQQQQQQQQHYLQPTTSMIPNLPQHRTSADISPNSAIGDYHQSVDSEVDSPPRKKLASTEDENGMGCPICCSQFENGSALADHVKNERASLDSMIYSLKEQLRTSETDQGKDNDPILQSRAEIYERMKNNRKKRLHGKSLLLNFRREGSTPFSDKVTNDERSPVVTPTDNSVLNQSPIICPGCHIERAYLQSSANCSHLRCCQCWTATEVKQMSVKDEDKLSSGNDKEGAISTPLTCPHCQEPASQLRNVTFF